MTFQKILEENKREDVLKNMNSFKKEDVLKVLAKDRISLEDFSVLLSPEALPLLEKMAQKSRQLTLQRFGKTIQMFAPMYLSNECNNICTYCGYSLDNKIKRKTLTNAEILREVKALKELGYDHVLLVTGEANATVHTDYFLNAIKTIKPFFSNISIEVQPLETNEYKALQEAGVHSVLVYQETYNRQNYKKYHPKGKKSNFEYRIDTPERIGSAGIHKIGLGVLLGLDDWRTDSFYCAAHLQYLQKKYWKSKFSISFPRIRPAEGVEFEKHMINDKELLQLICAYRIFNPDVEISISTRETAQFRNNIIGLGATSMSAGSKTNPGGYAVDPTSLEQFEIDDARPLKEFMEVVSTRGYEPVLKDWDKVYS